MRLDKTAQFLISIVELVVDLCVLPEFSRTHGHNLSRLRHPLTC
jgi:hypothetical protein